jgi:hypothetical protein
MSKPWPVNWRELLDKSPKCDRCKTVYSKLYCLSEEYPNITVCASCISDYHAHIKDFVDDIKKNKDN